MTSTAHMTGSKTKGSITLQGSAAMIREFFHYGINNILYQRGVYPPDSFSREKRFNMTLLVSNNQAVLNFLEPFLSAMENHLAKKDLRKMVVVISDVKTKETMERWVFEIKDDEIDDENKSSLLDEKKVKAGMADVLRQITASVTFLPQIESECCFDVLLGVKRGTNYDGDNFQQTTGMAISNAESVQLRSFRTGHHDVKAAVEYKPEML